jgi:hypothetical protein
LPGQILQDRSETATLKIEIGVASAREPNFYGCHKKQLLITITIIFPYDSNIQLGP